MSETHGNGKSRLAWVKALVPIGVALMGFAGVALGVWAQIRAGNTNRAIDTTVEQLNDSTIPRLVALIDELRADNKTLAETLAVVRERVSRLEGRTSAWDRMGLGSGEEEPPAADAIVVGVDSSLDRILDKPTKAKAIPRLAVQQVQKEDR